MKFLQGICKNRDFIVLLRSPVINEDKKNKIIESITAGRITELTAAFIKLLGIKTRESNLPEIISAYIEQYNEIKGIHKVKITTARELSPEMKNHLLIGSNLLMSWKYKQKVKVKENSNYHLTEFHFYDKSDEEIKL